MLRLFTDTDCDVTPAIADEYGYRLISMPYSIDGQTVYPYRDFDSFDSHTFYDRMRAGVLPVTNAISREMYISYFEPVFASGDDILYVHFSAAMSASFDFMELALQELRVKYPERRFYSIDTKGISALSLNIAREIGELYRAGRTAEEIVEWANREIFHFAIYFYADDLKFFHRSGRVSGLTAFMGNMIGVRPIINIGEDGKMKSIGKERGRQRALDRVINYVKELGDDVADHNIVIGHTDVPELAAEAVTRLRELYGEDAKIEVYAVNPTIGSHCGPGCLGISFHAIHR